MRSYRQSEPTSHRDFRAFTETPELECATNERNLSLPASSVPHESPSRRLRTPSDAYMIR
jgi:hypothetical protein